MRLDLLLLRRLRWPLATRTFLAGRSLLLLWRLLRWTLLLGLLLLWRTLLLLAALLLFLTPLADSWILGWLSLREIEAPRGGRLIGGTNGAGHDERQCHCKLQRLHVSTVHGSGSVVRTPDMGPEMERGLDHRDNPRVAIDTDCGRMRSCTCSLLTDW